MPTHSRVDVIGHAIRSVLDQTRPDFELLVVGDGCAAGTEAVVAGFGDPRIRFFDLPKAPYFGYANRNIALGEAKGALIGFAADDDLLFPDHLETLERGLAGDAALAYSQALWVSTDGVAAPFLTNLEMADELQVFMDRANSIPASCVLYRADALPSPGAWPENAPAAADLLLWRRIIGENPGNPLAYCRTPTVLHFSARWKKSRHSGMGQFAALLDIADGADWWPDALRLAVPEGQTEQAVFAGRMRHEPGWAARMRRAAADVAARIAWDEVTAGRPAPAATIRDLAAKLQAQEARAVALEAKLATRNLIIREIRNSTSWRITAPMRALSLSAGRFLRNARRALRA